MSREWRLYLEDIRDACRKVRDYPGGMSREAFLADTLTYDAVVRNLEIVGEAVRHIPAEVLDQMPGIEWRRVSDMRNILAHAYFGIDDDILWDVIRNHAPAALSAVERFLDANQE